MSIYSTLEITREDAIRLIQTYLFQADDEKLSEMAFEAWSRENHRNFSIVLSYDPKEECFNWNMVRND